MPTEQKPWSSLRAELETISDAAEASYTENQMEQVLEHGMWLTSNLARVATIKSDALVLLKQRELEVMNLNRDFFKSPSVLGKIISANCAHELGVVELADSLFSALKYKIEFYRSVMSKYKEELAQNRGFNQGQQGSQ